MSEPTATDGLTFEARWEKPLVAAGGGEAIVLIRIVPGPRPPAGTRRAPVDVAFALDRSGSMSGEKLRLVKEAVDVAVGLLREEDRVALTVYDNRVQTLQGLAAATDRTKTALRLALHGVDAGGSTALADGWLTACRELAEAPSDPTPDPAAIGRAERRDPFRVQRTVLLSDGLANVGLTDPAALTEHAHELRRRGVGTTTLGVGRDVDDDLLAGLAEAGGGHYEWIERASALRTFFEREIGELLTIAAGDLRLTISLPHGVRGTLLSAYPAEREGKQITVALGDLAAGQEIPLLLSLQIAPGALGTAHRIAVEAVWADPAADARRKAPVAITPLVYADAATVEATTGDPRVQEQLALQCGAAAQREAVRLDRAGRYAERNRVLHETQAMLAAAPATEAVVRFRAQQASFAKAPHDAPLAEEQRKQATWDAHRISRGRRRDE